jgi:hypothetical protein
LKKNLSDSLISVGFWREHCGDPYPSIFDASIKKLEDFELEKIENYLVKSPICVASPGIVYSAFSKDRIAGTSSIRTDGSWVWHDTLPYYVREHSIALPFEFLEHIRHRDYMPLSDDEVCIQELSFPW